jgi:hypothetical protein
MDQSTPASASPRAPSKFTPALFEAVVENILDGSDTKVAIEREGISARHFYRKIKEQPALARRFKDAQTERDQIRYTPRVEEAERELHRRGVQGWEEPVFDVKGQFCGTRPRYSDACLIFLLKSLRPDRYAESPSTLIQQNTLQGEKENTRQMIASWRQRLNTRE